MDGLRQDLRYAFRTLARNRGFTAVAVLALALGIGANTAIFTVVDAVLLRPFPYANPDRLVLLWGTKAYEERRGLAGPDVDDLRQQNRVFDDIVPFLSPYASPLPPQGAQREAGEEIEKVNVAYVGPRVFSLLGVKPARGRAFLPEEDEPGNELVAVLSHRLWQRRFGGERELLGRTVTINDEIVTVVGIMPPGFFFPDHGIEVWRPLARNFPGLNERGWPLVHGVARLRPGVQLAQAQAEMETIALRLEQAYPDTNKNVRVGVFPLYEVVVREFRTALWTLLAAVGLVLLLACANVANLLLSRAVSREKEIAIRATLGASRARIIRQLLTESVLLALVAATVGLLLAHQGLELIAGLGLRDIPRIEQVSMDHRVLGFTLIVSLATGLLFGLVPALQSSRLNLVETLKQGGMTTGGSGRGQLLDLLAATEIALALILLIAAGLLITSFVQITRADWGFDAQDVLVVDVRLPWPDYQEPQRQAEFVETITKRLRNLPGVESAAMGGGVPLHVSAYGGTGLSMQGRLVTWQWSPRKWRVSRDYFRTLGIPILKGRGFIEQDSGTDPRTVVINETLAKRLWPTEDPIGERIQFMKLRSGQGAVSFREMLSKGAEALEDPASWAKAEDTPREVVGVVANVRMFGLDLEPGPAVYVDQRQSTGSQLPLVNFVLRTSVTPMLLADPAKSQIWATERDASIPQISTLEEIVNQSIGGRGSNKLLLVVSSVLGIAALLLAAAGIYGVMSYSVGQRTQELGVRMALGAQRRDILKLVLRRGLLVTVAGLAFGLAGSLVATRALSSHLFGITVTDPATFAGVSLGVILVALLACYVPARRATKLDPITALRYE